MPGSLIDRGPRNLIIVRAGDDSLHRGWIAGRSRDFDLFISYYGKVPDRHREEADLYEMRPGAKWPCLGQLLAERPELLERYDAFWFPDDDISATTDTLNRMFALFHAFQLSLAQPALTQDSYYTWDTLLQHPRYIMRHCRFVEVMVPIFDRPALHACKASFLESPSGWGLDWLWPELCGKGRPDSMAILDATPVRHTRPLGGNLYSNNPDLDPRQDERRILQKYGLEVRRAMGKYEPGGSVIQQTRRPLLEQLHAWLRLVNAKRRLGRRRPIQSPDPG